MRTLRLTFVILITGLFLHTGFAQEERDLAAWNSLELAYKINKNWDLGLEGQLRLKENFQAVDEYFGEFTVNRRLTKGFDIRLGLRYIRRNDNQGNVQGYDNRFRYHLDGRYKHKLGSFRLNYRLRYQNRNELGISRDEGDFNVKRLRFKTGVEYKIKDWKLDPKMAFELFSRFEEGTESSIDKFRFTVGTEYDLNKAGAIRAFWRLERSIGEAIPESLYIIGLGYKYNIN